MLLLKRVIQKQLWFPALVLLWLHHCPTQLLLDQIGQTSKRNLIKMTDQDANVVSQAPVDETPISPSRPNPARKNSLEHHLAHRPDRQELINKNILPASTAAPAIQAQQKELEKHMRADSLNEKIAHRPAPETVLEKHIIHEDPRSPEDKYAEAIEDEYAKREGGA